MEKKTLGLKKTRTIRNYSYFFVSRGVSHRHDWIESPFSRSQSGLESGLHRFLKTGEAVQKYRAHGAKRNIFSGIIFKIAGRGQLGDRNET